MLPPVMTTKATTQHNLGARAAAPLSSSSIETPKPGRNVRTIKTVRKVAGKEVSQKRIQSTKLELSGKGRVGDRGELKLDKREKTKIDFVD